MGKRRRCIKSNQEKNLNISYIGQNRSFHKTDKHIIFSFYFLMLAAFRNFATK